MADKKKAHVGKEKLLLVSGDGEYFGFAKLKHEFGKLAVAGYVKQVSNSQHVLDFGFAIEMTEAGPSVKMYCRTEAGVENLNLEPSQGQPDQPTPAEDIDQ